MSSWKLLQSAPQGSMMHTSISSTPAQTHDDVDNRPHDLRLVFVGDSVTRFTYTSLVYFLKHGVWAGQGNYLLERPKGNNMTEWNDWLVHSHNLLKPDEVECDCYRYWQDPFKWYRHCENRYYIDHERQNYIAFITKMGSYPFHGHVLSQDVFQHGHQEMNMTMRDYDWVYPTWSELVDKYISQWNPKPTFFVFNQGFWKQHELRSTKVLMDLKQSLDNAQIHGFYRTTTFRSDEDNYGDFHSSPSRKHDKKVCMYFDCVNVSWTASTPPSDYLDPIHFKATVSNQIVKQILSSLEPNASKSG